MLWHLLGLSALRVKWWVMKIDLKIYYWFEHILDILWIIYVTFMKHSMLLNNYKNVNKRHITSKDYNIELLLVEIFLIFC